MEYTNVLVLLMFAYAVCSTHSMHTFQNESERYSFMDHGQDVYFAQHAGMNNLGFAADAYTAEPSTARMNYMDQPIPEEFTQTYSDILQPMESFRIDQQKNPTWEAHKRMAATRYSSASSQMSASSNNTYDNSYDTFTSDSDSNQMPDAERPRLVQKRNFSPRAGKAPMEERSSSARMSDETTSPRSTHISSKNASFSSVEAALEEFSSFVEDFTSNPPSRSSMMSHSYSETQEENSGSRAERSALMDAPAHGINLLKAEEPRLFEEMHYTFHKIMAAPAPGNTFGVGKKEEIILNESEGVYRTANEPYLEQGQINRENSIYGSLPGRFAEDAAEKHVQKKMPNNTIPPARPVDEEKRGNSTRSHNRLPNRPISDPSRSEKNFNPTAQKSPFKMDFSEIFKNDAPPTKHLEPSPALPAQANRFPLSGNAPAASRAPQARNGPIDGARPQEINNQLRRKTPESSPYCTTMNPISIYLDQTKSMLKVSEFLEVYPDGSTYPKHSRMFLVTKTLSRTGNNLFMPEAQNLAMILNAEQKMDKPAVFLLDSLEFSAPSADSGPIPTPKIRSNRCIKVGFTGMCKSLSSMKEITMFLTKLASQVNIYMGTCKCGISKTCGNKAFAMGMIEMVKKDWSDHMKQSQSLSIMYQDVHIERIEDLVREDRVRQQHYMHLQFDSLRVSFSNLPGVITKLISGLKSPNVFYSNFMVRSLIIELPKIALPSKSSVQKKVQQNAMDSIRGMISKYMKNVLIEKRIEAPSKFAIGATSKQPKNISKMTYLIPPATAVSKVCFSFNTADYVPTSTYKQILGFLKENVNVLKTEISIEETTSLQQLHGFIATMKKKLVSINDYTNVFFSASIYDHTKGDIPEPKGKMLCNTEELWLLLSGLCDKIINIPNQKSKFVENSYVLEVSINLRFPPANPNAPRDMSYYTKKYPQRIYKDIAHSLWAAYNITPEMLGTGI
ncbi:uncharacterized protein NEMAJ01_2292 [Nematocida major]|uniref:uncharacterized protein n=1 Tax=Nematocida major TaxID=1912982 RepID=UPI00200811DF|nr:uncharacterized protein NEMAJ01_2292 [Nematocida major]KAH9387396.1 hypothetical protein NEMAJ01_2292 [Nematocida major]